MKYYCPKTGILSNSKPDNAYYYYCEDTDGEWSDSGCSACNGNETIACPVCNGDGHIDGDEGDITCTRCNGNETIACPECEEYV